MKSSLNDELKKFDSIEFNAETAAKDMKDIKNAYKFKVKFDFLSLIIFVVGVGLACLFFLYNNVGFILSALGIVIILASIVCKYYVAQKRQAKFFIYYSLSILNQGKVKYGSIFNISQLYPIYIKCDNTKKTLKLIYQDAERLYFSYDDILNYQIMVDDNILDKDRLELDDIVKCYSLTLIINHNDNKKSTLKFDNTVKAFVIKGKYDYEREANANAINEIAKILERIIKKNNA